MRRKLFIGVLCILLVCCVADNASEDEEDETDKEPEPEEPDLKVTTIVQAPFVMLKNSTESGQLEFEGFLVDVLKDVGKRTGLSYRMHLVADGMYGHRIPGQGEQWSGMIGELMSHRADLAVASLTVTENRKTAVDFTEPFMTVHLTALVPKDTDINNVEELQNQTEIVYGCINGGATAGAFRSQRPPSVYNKMWSAMASAQGKAWVKSTKEGVDRVLNGDYAFIAEAPFAEYLVSQHPCELQTIERFVVGESPGAYAFAMPKHHDHYDEINDAILELRKDGVLTELYREWWKREECSDGNRIGGNGGGIVQLSCAILILYSIYNIFL